MEKIMSIILFVNIASSFAQTNERVIDQWRKINLKDTTIELPPQFAISKKNYKGDAKISKNEEFYDALEVIAESNEKGKNASIKISTYITQKGDYSKITNLSPLSDKDIEYFNKLNIKNFTKQKDLNGNLIKYFPIKTRLLNKIPFICYGYKRQLINKPIENISEFYVYDDDRTHQITITYNSADETYWKSYFERIMNNVNIKANN